MNEKYTSAERDTLHAAWSELLGDQDRPYRGHLHELMAKTTEALAHTIDNMPAWATSDETLASRWQLAIEQVVYGLAPDQLIDEDGALLSKADILETALMTVVTNLEEGDTWIERISI